MGHQLGDVLKATGRLQHAPLRRLHGPAVDLDDADPGVPRETEEPAQQDRLAHPRDAVHVAHAPCAAVHEVGQDLQFCLATEERALLPHGWPDHESQYWSTTAGPTGPSRLARTPARSAPGGGA